MIDTPNIRKTFGDILTIAMDGIYQENCDFAWLCMLVYPENTLKKTIGNDSELWSHSPEDPSSSSRVGIPWKFQAPSPSVAPEDGKCTRFLDVFPTQWSRETRQWWCTKPCK